jgi:hypothetical protein
MRRSLALGSLFLALTCFVSSNLIGPSAALGAVKKRRGAKKEAPSAGPTEREKKLLGWTTSYPTSYAVERPDFFIRGTVVDFKPVPATKGEYEINVLPIEVMNNPNHYITLDHYKNGITLRLPLSKGELKILRKGGTIEYNQYSKEIPGQEMGHAKLISSENYTEFKPYNVAPVAYLSKPGMEPEQLANALTGTLLYSGPIDKTEELKTSLNALSSNSDANISQKAKELSAKLFTGK